MNAIILASIWILISLQSSLQVKACLCVQENVRLSFMLLLKLNSKIQQAFTTLKISQFNALFLTQCSLVFLRDVQCHLTSPAVEQFDLSPSCQRRRKATVSGVVSSLGGHLEQCEAQCIITEVCASLVQCERSVGGDGKWPGLFPFAHFMETLLRECKVQFLWSQRESVIGKNIKAKERALENP